MSSSSDPSGHLPCILLIVLLIVAGTFVPPAMSSLGQETHAGHGSDYDSPDRSFSPGGAGGLPLTESVAAAPGEPVTAVVRAVSPEHWRALRAAGAKLYLKGEEYSLVKVDSGALPSLDAAGLQWKRLETGGAGELYYFIPGPGSRSLRSPGVSALAELDGGKIVMSGEDGVLTARAEGYLTVPLDRGWEIRPSGFLDLDFVHDEVVARDRFIAKLARRVDPDTLASYIQRLEDFGTRHSESDEIVRAGRWIVNTLGRFGYPDTTFESLSAGRGISAGNAGNVTGSKPGLRRPEFRILVGGHYDSITNGEPVPPQLEAPGADDNASGTAAALEVARLLADVELDATVEYVLFSEEEQGLRGSRRFATQLVLQGVPADKLFFINMDMIGNSDHDPWRVKIFTDSPSKPLARLVARVTETYAQVTPVMMGNTGRSDHASLQQVGYPAIMLHENDFSPFYHSRQDLLVHLEMDYMAEVVRTVVATVLHLARLAEPPADVAARLTESGDTRLEWSHSTDADVLGYHVEILDSNGELVERLFTRENYAVLPASALGDTAWARVRAEDVLGEGDASERAFVGQTTRLLAEAFPNPTTTGAQFEILIPGPGPDVTASVRIVDVMGRLVATLHEGTLSHGPHTFTWDGRSSDGKTVPAGIYFYVARGAGFRAAGGKLMVVR